MAIAELKGTSPSKSEKADYKSSERALNLENMQVISRYIKSLLLFYSQGAFFLWMLGMLAAMLAFSLEVCAPKKRKMGKAKTIAIADIEGKSKYQEK